MAGLNRPRLPKPERWVWQLPIGAGRPTDTEFKRQLPTFIRAELVKGGRVLSVSIRGRTVEVKTTGRRPVPGNPGRLVHFAMARDYDAAIEQLKAGERK